MRETNGARLQCTDATTAIVVEYYDYWPEAVGQALAFAARTGLTPGIVLVCRSADAHCAIAAHAVEAALAPSAAPFRLWTCRLTDPTLAACSKRH